ncbi:MAG: hypothetical protein KC457_09430 [Myxococcales bacterium]|nr:hypothetical protein [Myxococcales bacterium]
MAALALALLAPFILTQTLEAQAAPLDSADELVAQIRAGGRPAPEAFDYQGTARMVRFDPGQPASRGAEKLLALAKEIEAEATDVTYSHSTSVSRRRGRYHFDCSGMMNWMLERVAPKALETINRERPVASSYVRVIESAPTDRHRKGWQRVEFLADVRPGDIFAWRRPANWPKGGNTGHVGIVAAEPEPVPHIANAYVIRVYDSTQYAHQDDAREADEATGFGTGTILFMGDDQGRPIGYGWYGSDSGGWYRTDVVFGRL